MNSTKKLTQEKFICPNCHQETRMEIITSGELYFHEFGIHNEWHILYCIKCSNVQIIRHITDQEQQLGTDSKGQEIIDSEKTTILIDPRPFKLFKNLPEDVQRDYESAIKIIYVDYNASVTMIRRTLESVCNDKGAPEPSKTIKLYHRIKWLADHNHIPPAIADIAQEMRAMGNIGVHSNKVKVKITKDDALLMQKLCETVLEYVYEAPEMLKELKNRLNN